MINKYSILNGSKYFSENGSQNYLLFQLLSSYFTTFTGTNKILFWRSKKILAESIKTLFTSDNRKLINNLDPDKYGYIGFYPRSKFPRSNDEWDKNVVLCGVDNSSSMHVGNKS